MLGVAGGCWDHEKLMIMKWIIPSFPIWSTSKNIIEDLDDWGVPPWLRKPPSCAVWMIYQVSQNWRETAQEAFGCVSEAILRYQSIDDICLNINVRCFFCVFRTVEQSNNPIAPTSCFSGLLRIPSDYKLTSCSVADSESGVHPFSRRLCCLTAAKAWLKKAFLKGLIWRSRYPPVN